MRRPAPLLVLAATGVTGAIVSEVSEVAAWAVISIGTVVLSRVGQREMRRERREPTQSRAADTSEPQPRRRDGGSRYPEG